MYFMERATNTHKNMFNSGWQAFIRASLPEWPTWLAIVFCYGSWWSLGYWLYPVAPWAALVGLAIVVAFHSSLQHEAIHTHPTPSALCNEVLLGLPLGLAYPYRRYRETHLQHHDDERLTDPHADPESYYWDGNDWAKLGRVYRFLLSINQTLLGRLLLGPVLGSVRFFITDMRRIAAGNRGVALAWVIHVVSILIVAIIVTRGFHMSFWLYALGPAYIGTSLIGMRSFCEHRWHDATGGRTIIVEGSLLSFLFLFNNLHSVHHRYPGQPWFRMRKLYYADRTAWLTLNHGYVFKGYRAILWQYLLRAKEPLLHPAQQTSGEKHQS